MDSDHHPDSGLGVDGEEQIDVYLVPEPERYPDHAYALCVKTPHRMLLLPFKHAGMLSNVLSTAAQVIKKHGLSDS
jgi:hypothetical protein